MFTLSPSEKQTLDAGFAAAFGEAPEQYFSAPGRTEIGGNQETQGDGSLVLRDELKYDTML